MTLIALFSDKGSPGVSTLTLALAAVWPRRVLIAELDPAGGDLALRLIDGSGCPVLAASPGLVSLAAAARADDDVSVWAHAHLLPLCPDAAVLPGLTSGDQGSGIATLWPAVAARLASLDDGDVLADLGRLQPGSPAHAVAERADVLFGVGSADAEGILRLRDRLTHLLSPRVSNGLGATGAHAPRATVALVGEDRLASEAVRGIRTVLTHAGLAVTVAGHVARDPGAVADLYRGQDSARLRRSLLLRSVRTLLPALTGNSSPTPVPGPAGIRRSTAVGVR